MSNSSTIWLPDAKRTQSAGASIVESLYGIPVTIWLTGTLGAGKTTLLQGLGTALNIPERLTSPTYALEQRYHTEHFGELLHIDLYRLTPHEAEDLVQSSHQHHGIRCIEWADRLPESWGEEGIILALNERPDAKGRDLTVTFRDMPLPTRKQVLAWREEFCLSHLIGRHCDAVADTAVRLGEALMQHTHSIIRLDALQAAGWVHDLMRFVDFHRGTSHVEREINPEHANVWENVKARYPGLHHEAAVAQFLAGQGFAGLAEIVRVHGLTLADSTRITIEQRLLYYADKRVKMDDVVSLDERLLDFTERYSRTGKLTESDAWYDEARRTEHDLFPDGPPF
ncbi:tRNA (adenosine(37)-N6)-threonylcarbamoyltransferase complex ATPase subunit type 1 TsaE [Candidatus Peregrinibacteria bacterium CG1_02_54_53]|nr:MAG: tRNA (adenosine(37)-N6)-threonylcarbamoyltransferase complex ATPase subunit type 1 TsaE [Candidatus Peregrinibacteria bacterium CG1_02_54_53]